MGLDSTVWTYATTDTPETIKARLLNTMAGFGYIVPVGSVYDQLFETLAGLLYDVGVKGSAVVLRNIFLDTMLPANLPNSDEAFRDPPLLATLSHAVVTLGVAPGASIAAGTRVSTASIAGRPAQLFTTDALQTDVDADGVISGVAVTNTTPGAAGNVAPGTIIFPIDAPGVLLTVTNPAEATGGTDDEELDVHYRFRLEQDAASDPGLDNVDAYIKLALALPGVGWATVQPGYLASDGVLIVVLNDDGTIPSSGEITTLQALVDPPATPGQGRGLAAQGDFVTVAAPTTVTVNVTIPSLLVDPKFSIASVEASIDTALAALFLEPGDAPETALGYLPGDDPQIMQIQAAISAVPGVRGFGDVLLNGAHANVAISVTQLAQLGTITYSPAAAPWTP